MQLSIDYPDLTGRSFYVRVAHELVVKGYARK